MANVLALEASTVACSVALSLEGRVVDRFRIAPRQQSDLLLGFVDEVLSEAGVALSHLDAIAFGCGPGSFMGVRLATGVAQGLAWGAGLPVIPASTLQALAQAGHEATQSTQILAAWDARMDEVYWGAYERDANGLMQAVSPDCLQAPEKIVVPPGADWLAVGNAWEIYRARLSAEASSQFIDSKQEIYPSARALLPWAEYQLERGEVLSPEQAEPTYLREKVTSS